MAKRLYFMHILSKLFQPASSCCISSVTELPEKQNLRLWRMGGVEQSWSGLSILQ